MATLYLFRHGQTDFNRDKRFTGWLDSKLTELGVQQAKVLGEMLKNKAINLAIRTRLSRSKDTLKEVMVFHPECQTTIEENLMIERSYGDLAGLTHEEVIKDFGQSQFDKWHRGFYDRPPGGESFEDVEKRVMMFIADLKKKYHNDDMGIAISAHGNSIRLFRKIMENASIDECVTWTIPYDKYFEYKI